MFGLYKDPRVSFTIAFLDFGSGESGEECRLVGVGVLEQLSEQFIFRQQLRDMLEHASDIEREVYKISMII